MTSLHFKGSRGKGGRVFNSLFLLKSGIQNRKRMAFRNVVYSQIIQKRIGWLGSV
jgi:hypothetical protein